MLEELKNLNYHGGKDGLLFFLCDVIGRTGVSIRDAEVICSHAPGKRQLSVEDLVSYCIVVISGKDIVDILISAGINSVDILNDWLESNFGLH